MKQRIVYSCGHPGSISPTVTTNKDAYVIYSNMNNDTTIGLYKLHAFARKHEASSACFAGQM